MCDIRCDISVTLGVTLLGVVLNVTHPSASLGQMKTKYTKIEQKSAKSKQNTPYIDSPIPPSTMDAPLSMILHAVSPLGHIRQIKNKIDQNIVCDISVTLCH